MRYTQRGVTLIELLTVVVIVAILASIAVPSYRNYLIRAQRTDATTALLRIQSGMEKYLVQNGKYTTDVDSAGGPEQPRQRVQGLLSARHIVGSSGARDDPALVDEVVGDVHQRTHVFVTQPEIHGELLRHLPGVVNVA